MWKRRARELQAACFASKDVIKACIETLASFVQRPRGSLTRGRAGPPSLNRSRILEIVWPARAWRLPASGHISKGRIRSKPVRRITIIGGCGGLAAASPSRALSRFGGLAIR